MKDLISAYRKIRPQIKKRLSEFSQIHKAGDKKIFQELCFCLLTANANALHCDKAIKELEDTGLLFTGKAYQIRPKLRGRVRFHNKKADFIIGARKLLNPSCHCEAAKRPKQSFFRLLRRGFAAPRNDGKNRDCPSGRGWTKVGTVPIFPMREWLVENIKGLGYKEASHFLRNIGLGKDIAILDRHILKNLQKYGVIDKIPSSLGSRRVYLEIEEKMKALSKETRIPLEDMDLLFWSLQTGFIFK